MREANAGNESLDCLLSLPVTQHSYSIVMLTTLNPGHNHLIVKGYNFNYQERKFLNLVTTDRKLSLRNFLHEAMNGILVFLATKRGSGGVSKPIRESILFYTFNKIGNLELKKKLAW